MIVGFHNFVDALVRYKNEVFSSEGGLSIVMMDGLLLIPLAMAAFFYPVIALELTVLMVAISVLGMVLTRAYHRGRLRLPHRHRKV